MTDADRKNAQIKRWKAGIAATQAPKGFENFVCLRPDIQGNPSRQRAVFIKDKYIEMLAADLERRFIPTCVGNTQCAKHPMR